MNFKAAHKYQLNEYLKSVKIYYLVVFLVFVFFGTVISIGNQSDFNSTGGLEMSSVIFLFVVGLNSFKETFLMLLQNGISRKTMLFGRLATMGMLCTGMMVIDRLVVFGVGQLLNGNPRFRLIGMYEQFYYERAESLGTLQSNLEGVLFTLCFYILSIAVGYFISIAYYRMNKTFKIAVSVGLPVSFFFLLPIIDSTITDGRISRFLGYFIGTIFGFNKEQPFRFMLSSIAFAGAFIGLSWLLMRKAVDKK